MDKDNNSVVLQAISKFEPEMLMEALNRRPAKPMNTRTGKTVIKERRRLSNAPKSIQKRVLKRK